MDQNYRPNAVTLVLDWTAKEVFGKPGTQSVDRSGRPEYVVTVAQVGVGGSDTYRVTTLSAPPDPVPVGHRVQIDDPVVRIWKADRDNAVPQLVIRSDSVRVVK